MPGSVPHLKENLEGKISFTDGKFGFITKKFQ